MFHVMDTLKIAYIVVWFWIYTGVEIHLLLLIISYLVDIKGNFMNSKVVILLAFFFAGI